MAQAETTLITPRRNFLIRALGFTAAGATMAIPITTLASAEQRIKHHKNELMNAWEDYYAGFQCTVQGNGHTPDFIREYDHGACLIFHASIRPLDT